MPWYRWFNRFPGLAVFVYLSSYIIQAESTPSPVPASLFGLHILRLALPGSSPQKGRFPAPPPDFSFAAIRLHDSGVSWAEVETSENVYDWSRMDAWVGFAGQRGADLVLAVDDTPQWASQHPSDTDCKFADSGGGGCDMPSDIKYYQDYVKAVATRYRHKIKYYEGWNEANLGWSAPGARPSTRTKFFAGTNTNLSTLQSALYKTVKAADPDAQVISPSFTGGAQGITDVKTLLDTPGTCTSFDILGYHFYTPGLAPEVIGGMVSQLRGELANHAECANKPIWDTEFTWVEPTAFPPMSAPGYLARAYALAWNAGLKRLYWYGFNDSLFGAFHLDDPALLQGTNPQVHLDGPGSAYMKIHSWLVGKTMKACNPGTFYVCTLHDPDGNAFQMVWYAAPTTAASPAMLPFSIPEQWNVQSAEDINGNVVPQTGTALIGPNPVLFSPLPAANNEVSAASFNADFLSPGSLAFAYGSDLADSTAQSTQYLPELAGTSLDVLDAAGNHTAAIPLFVSPAKVDYWLPPGIAQGNANVTITNASGGTTRHQIRVTNVAPALFIQGTGLQGPPTGFVDYVNGANNNVQPLYQCNGESCSPAPVDLSLAPSAILKLYATGVRNAYQSAWVQIGGSAYPAMYVGAQPGHAGYDQVNVALPQSLAGSGLVPLSLIIDTQVSNTVTIEIK
jgi:uncharacterized protein (TIGR03437 family)